MTFYQYCESFPPILCRLLAQEKGVALTPKEISDKMGGSRLGWTAMVSEETEWMWQPLDNIRIFTRACGIDFCDRKQMARRLDYLRRKPTLDYLRASPDWKDYYLPLLVRWRKSVELEKVHPYVKALAERLTPIMK